MKKRLIPFSVGILVLVAIGVGVGKGWRDRAVDQQIAQSVPAIPALAGWPDDFRRQIEAASEAATGGADRVEALGELAALYQANGFFPEAIDCYRALLAARPGEAKWMHRTAVILAGFGRLEEALELWREAEKEAEDYLPMRIHAANALYKLNQLEAARAAFLAVAELEPENPYAKIGLARIDLANGKPQEARARLESIPASAGPSRALRNDLLVSVYDQLGQPHLGDALRSEGKVSGTFLDVRDPWIEELYDRCFDAYRLILVAGGADVADDPEMALRLLERAERVAPKNMSVHYQLGLHHAREKKFEAALRSLERCVALQPDFSDAWLRIFFIHRGRGEGPRALQALQKGLAQNRSSAALRLELGRVWARQGRTGEAAAEFAKAIELRPEEADAYIELALLHVSDGRGEEGAKLFAAALRAEPQNPMALSSLAAHAIAEGNKEEARRWLAEVARQPRIKVEQRAQLHESFRQRFGESP